MCNRYTPPRAEELAQRLGRAIVNYPPGPIFPRSPGPFVRLDREREVEVVVGQWGLVPWFAKTAKLPYSTNNARAEELAVKASYKQPWARGQRCLIPAESFDEPCWESGRNQWWRFRRADGHPWMLAGLWNRWVDKASGEIVESFTMLTLNADAHPLMSRMHKPDPRLGPDQQDKRSVIPVADGDAQAWMGGSVDQAERLLKLTPAESFDAGPADEEVAPRLF
ncbi:SOS response-associated peptidase [Piscinibacter sakaiensis]|uniref:SOS response-associated peptidase n=1 Tax=Piscinibacter sakaiensis TaxID=1547922 RepID=UPI003AB072F3